jgi:hypothetical protein
MTMKVTGQQTQGMAAPQIASEMARQIAEQAARAAAEAAARRAAEAAARRAAEERARATPQRDGFDAGTHQSGSRLTGQTSTTQGSSLRTENTQDGQVNCLDEVGDQLAADPALRAGSEVVFLSDSRAGAEGETGHVVIRRGNEIWDPATEQWMPTASFLRAHPYYNVVGMAPSESVHRILSAEPGPEREAALARSGLNPALFDMQVADDGVPMPGWLNQLLDPNVDPSTVTVPPYLQADFQAAVAAGTVQQWATGLQTQWEQHLEELRPNFDMLWDAIDLQQSSEEAWNAFAEEEMRVFFEGQRSYSASGSTTLTNPLLGVFLTGVGGGPQQWAPLTDGATHAQNLDLQQLITQAGLADNAFLTNPFNLCGQLVVASAGAWGRGALFTLANHLRDFLPTSQAADAPTQPSQIVTMLAAIGITAQDFFIDPQVYSPPATDDGAAMLDMLVDSPPGGMTAVLVNIDDAGRLHPSGQPPNEGQNIAHWVRVLDVSEDAAGNSYVRIYNPRNNREEVYSWFDFQQSWGETAGGSGFTIVTTNVPNPRPNWLADNPG